MCFFAKSASVKRRYMCSTFKQDLRTRSDIPISTADEDLHEARDYLPVITYVAGYCSYSINKKVMCDECRERIVSTVGDESKVENSLIKDISRGSLFYPSSDIPRIALIITLHWEKSQHMMNFRDPIRNERLQ